MSWKGTFEMVDNIVAEVVDDSLASYMKWE